MSDVHLQTVAQWDVGSPIGQCRAVPVRLGPSGPDAILAIYSADFDIDPSHEMFFFPSGTLKMALFTHAGELLWRRDLGPGVVPGVWFCPVFPFDLDGDGCDEIWFVDNEDPRHPLSKRSRRLACLDGRTGALLGRWPWPDRNRRQQELSFMYRDFILGGYVRGQGVLVTAQGTYLDMFLQGWRADMTARWEADILRVGDNRGAAGSHMCAVGDLNGDDVDEVLWGERSIDLGSGAQLFCADCPAYHGHSDIVQPVLDWSSGQWSIYTARESHPEAVPRVVMYDSRGRRLWGDVDGGHVDMGWVARAQGCRGRLAWAARIGAKACGPDGRSHEWVEEFFFDAADGRRLERGFSAYRTLPVDLDGDGFHELVRGMPSGDGEVMDTAGRTLGSVGAPTAMACKFLDRPGEHLLSYHGDGTLRVWADANAADSPAALARYAHPFYRRNRVLTATGYNMVNLGGV